MSRPKLLITADDYGMSPRFNQGILAAAHAGLITGISVMIKRKYIRKMDLLRLNIPLGLHLELEVTFSSYREITSQIKRFKKRFGRLPAYLDGHRHRHIIPENIERVIRAAKHYGLPVRSRLPTDRALLKRNCIQTPENFISWHPNRLPLLAERLHKSRVFPISELVVHPGYSDKQCSYTYNQEREAELAFLQSPSFHQLIQPFQLMGYTYFNDSAPHVRTTSPTKYGKRSRQSAGA